MAAVLREPVLSWPVLIIESDDWGPGPSEHAGVLRRVLAVLTRYRDHRGRFPVLTLGIVLRALYRSTGISAPHQTTTQWVGFRDPVTRQLADTIREGCQKGVFALQLHSWNHLGEGAWLPRSPVPGSGREGTFRKGFLCTESLPPEWQSSWLAHQDGASGKSRSKRQEQKAYREAVTFREDWQMVPKVAVPPTFIWNDAVEKGWAAAGVQVIVTPGRRCLARDADNRPLPEGKTIYNGSRSRFGPIYLVRNVYFEPHRGHGAGKVLEALGRDRQAGRPTLVETHRWNFIKDEETCERTLEELERLYRTALENHKDLVFLNTEELAEMIQSPRSPLRERRLLARLRAYLWRIWQDRSLRKWVCLTGCWVPGFVLLKVVETLLANSPRRGGRKAF
ncbi:hypothetical protein SAMN02746041_02600 [Desulfacinum hydrothermale DSM 13146]|uniref:Polysaccharide deacetylase n=1 Tax=Desulfacinum hydrothermale DSM 13146 TaxID=1121390 RepID=A0A1W1XQP7_9BACT|nr:hypothetical protein [Desulfacinum hydrothermale]SMC26310.1 hypothetical protein SAMN02746041_02600 [Desulfacinum hydrothermale DSM 13146]